MRRFWVGAAVAFEIGLVFLATLGAVAAWPQGKKW
jgi:hypothetical protein